MNKFLPWLFLIPVLLLLAGLPFQIYGHLPYRISTVSYVLSLIGWTFSFCGILALSRGSKRCVWFFVLVAVTVIVRAIYGFWGGWH